MLQSTVSHTVRKIASAQAMQCRRLEGKVAVVTASTEGIGLSIARRFAQEGAKVMISSRKAANVEKAVSQLKSEGLTVSGIICHVAKKDDRTNLFKQTQSEFGGLDILVSNAAVNPSFARLTDCPEEVWDKVFDVNVKSTYMLINESLPYLRKSKSASIIIISSIAGYRPFSMLGAYSVSKTALFGLCQAAAVDLAPENIRVNCIAPGVIKTKFSRPLYENDGPKQLMAHLIPQNRMGEPHEIAGAAAFLASSDSSYMTGETIVIAGGMASRL